MISAMQDVLGLASGMLVGFSLGLVGGGGSILAVPLMVYVVGVPEPHVAIGTSAIAVAANAAVNLSNHARGGTVRWSCALPFAAAGIIGAFFGSIFGKMLDGQKLLALFALVMLAISALMLKTRARVGLPDGLAVIFLADDRGIVRDEGVPSGELLIELDEALLR